MARSGNEQLRRRAAAKRTAVFGAVIFAGVPLTILLGVTLLGDRSYMLISYGILAETMLPFFMVYERRRPKAREIVLIALMAALTTLGNLLSFSLLPFQAGTAMVIVSGVAFGPEAGFLIGAMARLICNFFQGQGTWTPWQMFAWGLLGFLAGMVFNRANEDDIHSRKFKVVMGPVLTTAAAELAAYVSYLLYPGQDASFWGWRLYLFGAAGFAAGLLLQKRRLPADGITLTAFTFAAVFILYGGIMNLSAFVTAISYRDAPDIGYLRGLYLSGFPFDVMHAFRAAVFMFFFGRPMLEKTERIKVKYGFYRI